MRYWTEVEARAELPRLRVLIDSLRRGAHQTSVARMNGHGTVAAAVVFAFTTVTLAMRLS